MSAKAYTLMRAQGRDRRHLLRRAVAAAGAAVLTGCDRLSNNASFVETLKGAQQLSHAAGRILAPKSAMAQEFSPSDVAPSFRGNGTLDPRDADYRELRKDGFSAYRLKVTGLVENPLELSLEQLRALPSRTQITRHDCVEGWSCIGKWKGVPFSQVLEKVKLKPEARYLVFHCADALEKTLDGSGIYYESIGREDAFHPQTILAYEMNDAVLPIAHGAPLRLRVERQLGYKSMKYVRRIIVADEFDDGGKKGNIQNGWAWYTGI